MKTRREGKNSTEGAFYTVETNILASLERKESEVQEEIESDHFAPNVNNN